MHKILLALLVFATVALSADFSGNWTGAGVTDSGSHDLYFVFKQAGSDVTGTGGPNADEQHQVANAKIEGDKLKFDVPVGEKGTLHFELVADGEGLKGTVEFKGEDHSESGTVTLKRAT
jgi:hypothetical protein